MTNMHIPVAKRCRMAHRRVIVFSLVLLMSGRFYVSSLAIRPVTEVAKLRTPNEHNPTRNRYLQQIDQQLNDLESRIGRLRTKKRSLKGPARDRLSGNVRMFDGKLHEWRFRGSGTRFRDGPNLLTCGRGFHPWPTRGRRCKRVPVSGLRIALLSTKRFL
jgi:hypothetical protein